ncbi:RodZ family helix-turn-helix domain-containing protein [Blastopirellula retiformator]|uniref:Bacterial type II and III secretion system protein n=1 Tax=Blastopirellula retiformator TaxID=2527970 RepID=A0A5C5V1E5_9BACT|nr:hypothetical protein [Blastopirellula retiformator]TWT31829.1 hypothetical protein Enr8_37540 [Blastopirellula retiformator]
MTRTWMILLTLLLIGGPVFAQTDGRVSSQATAHPIPTVRPPSPLNESDKAAAAPLATSPAPSTATSTEKPAGVSSSAWRSPSETIKTASAYSSGNSASPMSAATRSEPLPASGSLLKVTSGLNELPHDQGQVWRDYDITPYTLRVTSTSKPEQAIIDWILRETGTDVWFGSPLGLLHADKNTLRVYHTPEMQQIVRDVVEDFVESQAEVKTLGLRLVTVKSPNWRRLAYRMMQPVSVKTPGIEAWLLSKENAAILLDSLRKRSDYKEHQAANLLIHNGQSSAVSMLKPQTFMRSVRATAAWPGYELQSDQIEAGFSLEVSPLLAPDDRTIDAVLKCSVDQIEKFVNVDIDVPTATGGSQSIQVQIPQMVSWRLHERFRWPSDQVLLISCGVVAQPDMGVSTAASFPISLPLPSSPARADGLMFVEYLGPAKSKPGQTPVTPNAAAIDNRGRY